MKRELSRRLNNFCCFPKLQYRNLPVTAPSLQKLITGGFPWPINPPPTSDYPLVHPLSDLVTK